MKGEAEKILEWLEDINNTGKVILVEGKKDVNALKRLGVENVKMLNGPVFSFVERISKKNKEVIILTDLDKEGRKLYSMMKKGFERNGVKIEDSFRLFLFKETKLRQIEGIDTYIENTRS